MPQKSETVRVSATVVRRTSPRGEPTSVEELHEQIVDFRAAQIARDIAFRAGPPSKAARRTSGAVLEALGLDIERDGGAAHGYRVGYASGNARNAG